VPEKDLFVNKKNKRRNGFHTYNNWIRVIAGRLIFARDTKKQLVEAEQQAEKIIADAKAQSETIKKEKMLEAKENFVQLKAEHDKEILEKNRKINEAENRIRQKEQSINSKVENLDRQTKENDAIKENLNRQIEVVNQKRTELEKHQEEHIRRLEKVAGLTAEEAKVQFNRRSLKMPNKKRIKKRGKSLYKVFSVLLLSKLLKIR
jgi:ribonuclease Y